MAYLGPDVLGPDWDAGEAVARIAAHPDVPIAVALGEQRNLAGLGNVYVTWSQRQSGVYGAAIDRLSNFGRVWAQLAPAPPLEAAMLRTAAAPLVAAVPVR